MYAFTANAATGTIRKTFFMNMLSTRHTLKAAKPGDFLVDDRYLFEVGGKNKSFFFLKSRTFRIVFWPWMIWKRALEEQFRFGFLVFSMVSMSSVERARPLGSSPDFR
jgi:hypothetical protein